MPTSSRGFEAPCLLQILMGDFTAVVFIILFFFIFITVGVLLATLHFHKATVAKGEFDNLPNENLLEIVRTLGDTNVRQVVRSAMLTNGYDGFNNHITMQLLKLGDTGYLPDYTRQHLINVLEGKEPLLVEDHAILVA